MLKMTCNISVGGVGFSMQHMPKGCRMRKARKRQNLRITVVCIVAVRTLHDTVRAAGRDVYFKTLCAGDQGFS